MNRIALVVDDSLLIRHMVGRYLQDRGFQVESATNGVEAMELLSRIHPSVVITDMTMPHMDGAELVARIRQAPGFASTPVIVLAARGGLSESSARPAADHIVFKDIDIGGQLDRALDSALAIQ